MRPCRSALDTAGRATRCARLPSSPRAPSGHRGPARPSFDHDTPEVFSRTARWVEDTRLNCATFHILTPYPGTPQFARMEAEGRLLHRDWTRFDTAHAVFRPEQMSPERLEQGHAWLYRMFFSSRSFWARRPTDSSAVLPYRAVPWLYKRSHPLCRFLIQRQLTHAAWSPLVRLSRHRHLRFRRQRPALDAPSATLSLGLRPGV